MGAAYMFHLLKNHPFADGNKRTRTLCALVFLRENGLEAFPPDPKVEELAQGVAGGTISKDELTTYWESWVASN